MTKQEQIEEMTKDLENTILGLGIHLCRKSAEKLYDLGYRKIPENAVVLTKEEYIDLSRNYVKEQIEQARKETAKEILDKLSALMEQYHYKSTAWRNCANFIKETYGVEVEE